MEEAAGGGGAHAGLPDKEEAAKARQAAREARREAVREAKRKQQELDLLMLDDSRLHELAVLGEASPPLPPFPPDLLQDFAALLCSVSSASFTAIRPRLGGCDQAGSGAPAPWQMQDGSELCCTTEKRPVKGIPRCFVNVRQGEYKVRNKENT